MPLGMMMFTSPSPGNAPAVSGEDEVSARDLHATGRYDPAPSGRTRGLFDAVLFDRDGTLVHDVPYNGDPAAVRPVPGAREALDRVRQAGLRVGVVSNQSGLARGLFGPEDLARVNARVAALLGPINTWQICPHDEQAGCDCRKPRPALVHAAAAALGTVAARCVVVGDIGADMAAAGAAGAAGVLVPTPVTRAEEIAAAPAVAADLTAAVALILERERLFGVRTPDDTARAPNDTARTPNDTARTPDDTARATRPRRGGRVLVARPDSAGDVFVTGPAIRAVAAGARRVVMLCGPRGRCAAELLPGVDEIIEAPLPWIDPDPLPVDREGIDRLVDQLAAAEIDEAVLFTSFHQSALPLALALRMAGVPRISAISDDYPGSLLDVRHRPPGRIPEVERALSLAVAAGYPLPATDEPVLRLRGDLTPPPETAEIADGYVVVHPGSSVPARACPPAVCGRIVAALTEAGHRVVVTGGPQEKALCAEVAAAGALDLSGRTDLAGLAGVIARAGALVVGNTGPAHVAAALGVPVVSLFAPTVGYGQWGPYRVPVVRLGDATAPCRDTRVTTCPVPGHPCLASVDPQQVVEAVGLLAAGKAAEGSAAG